MMAVRTSTRIKTGLLHNENGPNEKQLQLARSTCRHGIDPSGFEEKVIDDYIGASVFTTKTFAKGDFLLEYQGDLIQFKEAQKRELEYKKDETVGSFMFYFRFKEKKMCVDATNDIFSLGRMVNDAFPGSKNENSSLKIVVLDTEPRLCLFATRNLKKGEELRYDYGIPNLPWRTKEKNDFKKERNNVITDNQEKSDDTDDFSDFDMIESGSEYKPSDVDSSTSDSDSDLSEILPLENNSKNIIDEFPNLNPKKRKTKENDTSSTKQQLLENRTDSLPTATKDQNCIDSEENMELDDNNSFRDGNQMEANETYSKDANENQLSLNEESIPPHHENQDSEVRHTSSLSVPTTNNASHYRSYDKKYYCLFCQKALLKLPPHLRSLHADEKEVIEWELEKDKKKKDLLYIKLRNLGNHVHNCEVLRSGNGEVCVLYRPTFDANIEDYGPCPFCYGYYVRRELWRHNCPLKQKGSSKGKIAVASKTLMPRPEETNSVLHSIVSNMKNLENQRIVKGDRLLMRYGEKLCTNIGQNLDQHNYIRAKLNELARFLKVLRQQKRLPSNSLEEYINPEYFRAIVKACKTVAEYDEKTNRFGKPSLALKIGYSLSKCADLLLSKGIEYRDKTVQCNAEEFLKLYEINWNDEISSNANKTLEEGKRNSGRNILPLAEDVKMFTTFLSNATTEHIEYFLDCLSTDKEAAKKEFLELLKIALARIIVFNRRRSGEVARMTLDNYDKKSITGDDQNGPIEQSLTAVERKLCHTLHRVEIDGKKGRTVPVIFNSEMVRCIDLLIKHRPKFVDDDNIFLFPNVYKMSTKHLRGCDCLRDYAMQCGAEEPGRLTSTRLRKQIATMSQIMNLKNNELDILANFLGHNIAVHREFYRLPEATLQVAKVSKVLMKMEQGGSGLNAGESLDSISLEEENNEGTMESSESEMESDSGNEDEENMAAAVPKTSKACVNTQKTTKKKAWSSEERRAVCRHLSRFIDSGKLPGKGEIDRCIAAEPVLCNRTWKNIKDFCRNRSITNKKRLQKQ